MNDNTPPPSQPKRRSEGFSNIASTVGVLLIAPLLALFLTAFVFQAYQVDGMSMEKTLQDQDRLIVWKIPRTWARITHHAYIPRRGDVVIFNETEVTGKQLVKRVIGLPGERLVVKDGTVTVYNHTHPQGFQPDKTLGYGSTVSSTAGNVDVTVGKNQVFLMGDNRNNSLDSRIFGPLDSDKIVGKLVARVWPADNAKRF